jgi:hypothetical protein
MKEIMVKQYQCDHCSKTAQFPSEIERHESTCLAEQKKLKDAQEANRLKLSKAREDSITAAKNDKALNLLVGNGLLKEAWKRAEEVYNNQVGVDCYSSSWFEEIFTAMVEAVKP